MKGLDGFRSTQPLTSQTKEHWESWQNSRQLINQIGCLNELQSVQFEGYGGKLPDVRRLVSMCWANIVPTSSVQDVQYIQDLKDLCNKSIRDTKISMKKTLWKMEVHLKKVTVWRNQCEHLFKKYREGVERAMPELDTLKDLEPFYMVMGTEWPEFKESQVKLPSIFICSKLMCSMSEGEALLLSCSGNEYNKAAFSLSLPPPCVPTFSKFALAFRKLDWTVDFLCCVRQESSFESWEWCEERCRLVHRNPLEDRVDVMEDESLEVDGCRQNADREALRTTLNSELNNVPRPSAWFPTAWFPILQGNKDNQDKLEAIWRKRLQPHSHTCKLGSPLDSFAFDTRDVPFAFPVAVDVALQIVEAIVHMHKCRVIHRDLKPNNILASPKVLKYPLPGSISSHVPEYYTIKLIDFGSSKSGDQSSHFHTFKQGTINYMAPEFFERLKEAYTWSADVYSFGVTCYEIFTGMLPFKRRLSFDDIQKVMCGEISFPFAHPEGLKDLIEKCCAQMSLERPSFEDVRKDLWRLKLWAWKY